MERGKLNVALQCREKTQSVLPRSPVNGPHGPSAWPTEIRRSRNPKWARAKARLSATLVDLWIGACGARQSSNGPYARRLMASCRDDAPTTAGAHVMTLKYQRNFSLSDPHATADAFLHPNSDFTERLHRALIAVSSLALLRSLRFERYTFSMEPNSLGN
jgi:hypothetical protein